MNSDRRMFSDKGWIDRIRNWLRESGSSQESLARALGCTRGAVGHYLTGRRNPTLAQLENIAQAMGVHPAWLLYGMEDAGVAEAPTHYADTGGGTSLPLRGTSRTGPLGEAQAFLAVSGIPSHCYALRVSGTDAWPRAQEGELLLLDPTRTPQRGDHVLVRLATGETALYELLTSPGDSPALGLIGDRSGKRFKLPENVALIHSVVGVLHPQAVSVLPVQHPAD
jgi:transcriptional regulator with XRE-family HTH domain